MLRNKRESIEWLEFEIFQEFTQIAHAIFLRHGGVSQAPYHGLNVGGGTGDNPKHIQENRALLLRLMGCTAFAGAYQVHGADVRQAPLESPDERSVRRDPDPAGVGQDEISIKRAEGVLRRPASLNREETPPFMEDVLQKCDGLYTEKEGIGLFIKHADCQAAIVYDPVQNVVANIHAGWKGNVLNIYQSTVDQLKGRFGSKPENLIVGISPSLGPCCAQFINYKTEFPEHFLEFQVKPLYFDLWEVARKQWMNAGILPHHLQIAKICTCCNKEDYFSYRRDKPTGRHATVILKKPSY